MGKAREWWIDLDLQSTLQTPLPDAIHVIEYSAFEAVVKERDDMIAAQAIRAKEIRDLTAQLAEEKDSLAHYKNELSLSLIASDRYKAQLAELKSYIPKVPTQPYEKEMAKQLSDLKRNAMSLRGMLAAHLAGGQPIDVTCVLAFDAFMKRMGE